MLERMFNDVGGSAMADRARENPNRRRLLAMTGGSLASAALVPHSWTRPVINSVILPAHAQTTGESTVAENGSPPAAPPEDIFSISCTAVCFNNIQQSFTFACVQGQLLASDGTDMTGVAFQVAWNFPSGPNLVTNHTAGADGAFGAGNTLCGPSADGVFSSVNVVVSFTDEGTFGTNTCESTPLCTS